MSYRDIHGPITAERAEAEPMDQRLFAESEDECTPSAATRKPSIRKSKGARLARSGSLRSSAACPNTSDSASYMRLLKKSRIKY